MISPEADAEAPDGRGLDKRTKCPINVVRALCRGYSLLVQIGQLRIRRHSVERFRPQKWHRFALVGLAAGALIFGPSSAGALAAASHDSDQPGSLTLKQQTLSQRIEAWLGP